MIIMFTSDQYEMLYGIYIFFSLQPKKKKNLEHVSTVMIKRKC